MTINKHRMAGIGILLSLLIGIIQLPVYAGPAIDPQRILLAQADTSKLQNKAPVPPVKNTGVDPKSVSGSTKSTLRIAGVSEVAAGSPSVTNVQGRGQVERVELSFSVSVSNSATSTDYFQLVTKVHGATTVNRTARFTIQASQTDRKTIRFVTEFQLPSGSTRLPITVILYNRENVEIDRTDRAVDMSTAITQLRGPMVAPPTRDLAVSEMTVNYKRQRADLGPVNIDTRRTLQAVVTVRNVGTERWGYPASLTVSYQTGRPGSLGPLTGNSGDTKPQTFDLRPGEQSVIAYAAPSAINPGYYYTATATISTRDDLNRENNTRQFVFFLESDGRITPVESGIMNRPLNNLAQ